MQDFQRVQKSLTEFVRDPLENAGPAGIESRRLGIYRDLLFKNIEGSLSNSFPVLRSIFNDETWLQMVRDFMRRHRCQSPYFVDLAEEFLDYLNHERQCASDPVFLQSSTGQAAVLESETILSQNVTKILQNFLKIYTTPYMCSL